jgi:hypothetical protein
MFLAVHASVGALAGNAVGNPVAAFALGFLSHFFIDMIPHGDARMYEGYKSGERRMRAVLYVAADTVATIGLIVAFFLAQDFFSPVNVALGIVGGLLPDVIVGFYEILKPKQRWWYRKLESFHTLHMKNHCWFGRFLPNKRTHAQVHELLHDLKFSIQQFTDRDIPMRYGLMLQVVMLAICLKVIL